MEQTVKMDVAEQIRLFKEFFESYYQEELILLQRKSKTNTTPSLIIDFNDLSKFNLDLANELLENPETTITVAEIALDQLKEDEVPGINARFKNISPSCKYKIGDIRSDLLEKLICLEGHLLRKSKILPKATSCRFECPVCGNLINIIQNTDQLHEPVKCGCGRKGKFTLISKELIDVQSLAIQEKQEELTGAEQPQTIHALLKGDLVSPIKARKMNPGASVTIVGILKEVPIMLRTGATSTSFDIIVDVNHIEAKGETYDDLKITEKEKEEILAQAKVNPLGLIKQSIAPTIYGHDELKEAIVLQMFGGVKKVLEDGREVRGDSHLLVIGDPGAGKTAVIKFLTKITPKWQYVSGGGGASGRGISAAVIKDEVLKTWTLDAGAAVLANDGVLFFDELDKMSNEERWAIHEVMESQSFTVNKAGIHATLMARTTILAAANPKLGRFDNYGLLYEQLNLEPTLINRFDLIFPLKDIPDPDRDKAMSSHILKSHRKKLEIEKLREKNQFMNSTFLKKYIAYSKKNIFPEITDEAEEVILNYYNKLRGEGYVAEEGKTKAIPINARYLEGIIRLTESCARVRLSEQATGEDAQKAVSIVDFCLRQFGFDQETGRIDIDRIAIGISSSRRDKYHVIQDVIRELQNKIGKIVPIDDVVFSAQDQGIKAEEVEELIQKMLREGLVYEPKRGFVSLL